MPTTKFTLSRVVLALTRVQEMVNFYSAVFEVPLQPVAAYGTTLHKAEIAGLNFVFCPNEIAGVEAEQNRHQFTYQVDNLDRIVELACGAGGTCESQSPSVAVIRDPDGNSLEFVTVPK